jgi:hypothetical protein
VLFAKYNWNNKFKEGELERSYRAHGGSGMHIGFWWEIHNERDY